MHALHLPRHLLGVTFLAALLTLVVMALLLLPGRLAPADSAPSADTAGAGAPTVTLTEVRPPFVEPPVWIADPVAPPQLGAPR
jgi:hypothetical protein